ncbi:MAG: dipeptide/oligopeptide/nickel ABC transporter ATP-binding protein [Clostridiales bacterium]|nr:dipeptide/oligopeptide/nickel ABC transporter ATP-binding protein [Clostridiales bacterium]
MEIILEGKDLTVTFPAKGKPPFTALDHVSFSLYAGETLGIAGESGSGKSTLARVVMRLLDPAQGTIFLSGEDITHMRGRALRGIYHDIQMVFQDPVSSFDPRRTLGDGIGESLRNRGLPRAEIRQRVIALLRQCELPEEYAGRYPHEVSGGECQRAAIARALAVQPRILICDEATSALDVTVQMEIMELLKRLKKEQGLSCLFISHNLALVQSFCDRLLVMHEGRVAEEGLVDKVIRNPQSEYTKLLIECVL